MQQKKDSINFTEKLDLLDQTKRTGPTQELRDSAGELVKAFERMHSNTLLFHNEQREWKKQRDHDRKYGPTRSIHGHEGCPQPPEEDYKPIDRFVQSVQNLPVEYKQSSFQCLGDYEKCVANGNNKTVCVGFLILSVVQQLIPFAGISGGGNSE